MKTIPEWPTPRSETEVIYFHGLASLYQNFISGFSSICGPLTKKLEGIGNNSSGI